MVTENRTAHDYFLFPEPHIYDYAFDDELSIIAYWKGHYKIAAAAALRAKDRCPPHSLPRVQANLDFALAKLKPPAPAPAASA
jgi:hypothetical protein